MNRDQQLKKLTLYPEWEVYESAVREDMNDLLQDAEQALDKQPTGTRLQAFTKYSNIRRGMQRALDIALDAK